jgi:hypothetical protein
MSLRKKLESTFGPLDEYGHLTEAPTDPYGELHFAIGSADDFVCFDYHLGAVRGRTVFVLHATVNSETGHFIQDFSYNVVDINDPKFKCVGAFEMECVNLTYSTACQALDWMSDNEIRHDKSGWNQDPYYILRAVAHCLQTSGGRNKSATVPERDRLPEVRLRFGGVRANKMCDMLADRQLHLPTTRPVYKLGRKG